MKYFFIFLLLFPVTNIAQKSDVLKLTSSAEKITKTASGWIALDSGWRFKAGDNPDWAKPGFDDSSWQSIHLLQDLYNVQQIPKDGIVWFRLRLINDSTFFQPLVMRLFQTGASEIYLDGKLIHKFGIVSSNPDSVKYFNPARKNLSFPLLNNTKQTLSIRFANLPNRYPVYFNNGKSLLILFVTTVDKGEEDYIVKSNQTFVNGMNMVIGVAMLLSVLYLSFFLFFPVQKINLYFSMSNFSFALYLICILFVSNTHLNPLKFYIPIAAFAAFHVVLFLYCIYKIFNQKLGVIYWSLLVAAIISIPSAFLIDLGIITPCLGIFVLTDILRISIKSLPDNKGGARIILTAVAIALIYFTLYLLSVLSVINIPDIDAYIPFAFLVLPLGLAIYLGYAFGKTSQSLRNKLIEVEQLSSEKQKILLSQNETLENQVRERTSALNQSLENLKSTQSQLIQSEKMASLGELTAGIAHEIQNPLNFVNNFSDVNTELIDELKTELTTGNTQQAFELANDIKDNEQKINHHGKRADAIVKGMLQHSRRSNGIKEPTDINTLADEYLRLSYHGIRAKEKDLNAILKTDFDQDLGRVNIIPQDIGRVLLNLYNNAFYAVNEKKKQQADGYEPTVSVSTKKIGDKVEIKVADNGNGIPQKVVDKIFQPFFTTKPAGQGTGLGLSLSYDIVKAHGGEIKVETKEGNGTVFVLVLPG